MFSMHPVLSSNRHMAVAAGLLTAWCLGVSGMAAAQGTPVNSRDPHRPYLELLHRVQAEKPTPAKLGYTWALLASSYQRSGETDAALRAYSQALPLLAKSSNSRVNYATALDNLGEVYLEAGDLGDAEQVREKAFRIRSELNDPIDLARSHQHLAETLLAQHHYQAAEEHAKAAAAILSSYTEPAYIQVLPEPSAEVSTRPGSTLLAAYITLTYASCQLSRSADCLTSAHMADEIATRDFAPVSIERAHADMALAFAGWKNGEVEISDRRYQTGTDMMKVILGESHPVVIISMLEYRDFLKSTHQKARANLITRQVERAQEARLGRACVRCTVNVAALP